MSKKRRTFSKEFKYEAAQLVLDQGHTVLEACRALDVGETSLRRWVDQLSAERGGTTPGTGALTPQQREIQQLQERIKRLEREKAILKKATALLVSDENTRTHW